jgi:DNA-binding NarL/FixJ family response regulator
MQGNKKRVFICEDHQIYIDGLVNLIHQNSSEFELVEACQNGSYASAKIPFLEFEILLLDLNIPGINGFELIEQIRKRDQPISIIVITMYDDPSMIKKVQNLGANAYLLKDVSNDVLLKTMQIITPTDFILQEGLNHPDQSVFKESFSNSMKLTMREKEIVQLIVNSKTTAEIAETLCVSPNTVETHRRNLYRKLEVKNLSELINFAHTYDLMS